MTTRRPARRPNRPSVPATDVRYSPPELKNREPANERACERAAFNASLSPDAAWEWLALRFGSYTVSLDDDEEQRSANLYDAWLTTLAIDRSLEQWRERAVDDVVRVWEVARLQLLNAERITRNAEHEQVLALLPTNDEGLEDYVERGAGPFTEALETLRRTGADLDRLIDRFRSRFRRPTKRGRGQRFSKDGWRARRVTAFLRALIEWPPNRPRRGQPPAVRPRDAAIAAIALGIEHAIVGTEEMPSEDAFNGRKTAWCKMLRALHQMRSGDHLVL